LSHLLNGPRVINCCSRSIESASSAMCVLV
jgi:hypothetical protein